MRQYTKSIQKIRHLIQVESAKINQKITFILFQTNLFNNIDFDKPMIYKALKNLYYIRNISIVTSDIIANHTH